MNEKEIYKYVVRAKELDSNAMVQLFTNTIDSQYPFVYCLTNKNKALTLDILLESYFLAYGDLKRLEDPLTFQPWLNEIVFRVAFGRLSGQEVPITYTKEELPSKINRQNVYRRRLTSFKAVSDHIIVLAYYCGLTVRQVGEVLGYSKQDVIKQYREGKARYNGVLNMNEENKALMKDFDTVSLPFDEKNALINRVFALLDAPRVQLAKPAETKVVEEQLTAAQKKIILDKPPVRKKKEPTVVHMEEKEKNKTLTIVLRVIAILVVAFFLIEPRMDVVEIANDKALPTYKVEVKSFLPIKDIQAIQYREALDIKQIDGKTFEIAPKRNGMMKITTKLINFRNRTEIVNVSGGDTTPPKLISQESSEGLTTLTLEDKESGIDFDHVEAKLQDGTEVKPAKINEDRKQVSFPFGSDALEVTIPDKAGNRLRLLLKPVN